MKGEFAGSGDFESGGISGCVARSAQYLNTRTSMSFRTAEPALKDVLDGIASGQISFLTSNAVGCGMTTIFGR